MPPQSAMTTPATTGETADPAAAAPPPPGLMELFAAVEDPRHRRGRIHPLPTVLALAACAVVAGQTRLQAIAEWARDLTDETYAALGVVYDVVDGVFVPPSPATFARVFALLEASALEHAATAWTSARVPTSGAQSEAIAVDGKSMRGSAEDEGPMVHLLSALSVAHGAVLAQQPVAAKSNEIPAFTELLDLIDDALLQGAVVSADALHTQRASAAALHERGAHYVFYAAGNQPRLYQALNALDWESTPVAHTDAGRGHGRCEVRTIQVRPAPADLPFPHAEQVFLLERYTLDGDGAVASASAELGLTSLGSELAGPERIMASCRGQWQIENPLHWVRDVVFAEDGHRLRKGAAPQVMACLRNLAISALRLAGGRGIASGTRWNHRRPWRPLQTLGIMH